MPSNVQTIPNKITDLPFFDNRNMERAVLNATLWSVPGLLAELIARPNNNKTVSYPTLTALDYDATGTEPDYPCDDPVVLNRGQNLCEISYTHGRTSLLSETFDTNEVLQNVYNPETWDDQFFIISSKAGISDTSVLGFGEATDITDNDLFAWAVMRQMSGIASRFALFMRKKLWSGDPTNNTANGGYKEFYGLELQNVDTWSTDATLPVTSMSGVQADCSLLDATITDFASAKISGGGLYDIMQEMEYNFWLQDFRSGMPPVERVWVMTPQKWRDVIKFFPCEMVSDSCAAGQINANDGGNGMFNLQERNRMQGAQAIELNGRTTRVIIDDGITETPDDPTPGDYLSDIHYIPLRVGSTPVTFIEYVNYSGIRGSERFNPIPNEPRRGWTDDGKFHHITRFNNWCFDVASKMENRLIYRAPGMGGRITNVVTCPTNPPKEPNVVYTEPTP